MHVLKMNAVAAAVVASVCAAFAARDDIAKYDKNMAVEGITVAKGLKWIDGKLLPPISCATGSSRRLAA